MANIDISSKLSHEPQTITIAEGKTYEVDCGAEMMLKAQDLFKKDIDTMDYAELCNLISGLMPDTPLRKHCSNSQ